MRGLLTSVLCVTALLAAPAHARNLTVFAAASTVQVLDEIRNEWNANQTPQFRVVYGSSGALARQLENGGPADIYFSANSTWVDYLVKNRIAINQTRQTLFRNRIVLVAPSHQPNPQVSLRASSTSRRYRRSPRAERPAGNRRPATRPRRHIRHARPSPASACGRASRISTVRTRNVRLALALVQRGEAPLGIVYYTDAIQTGQVRIVATFNGALHAPVAYQAVAVATSNRRTEHQEHATAR